MKDFKRLSFVLVLVAILGFQASTVTAFQGEQWEAAGSEEAGFLIDFPGHPQSFKQEGPTGLKDFRFDLQVGKQPDGLFFRATSTPFSEKRTREDLTKMLVDTEDFIKGIGRSLEAEVQKTWAYKLGDYPARSGRLIGSKNSAQVVVIVGKTRYFVLLVLTERASLLDRPEVSRFLNSFDFYAEGVARRKQGNYGGVSGPSEESGQPLPAFAEWIEFEPDDKVFSLKLPRKPELSETEHQVLGKVKRIRCRESLGGKVVTYAVNYNPVKSEAVAGVRKSTITEDNLSKSLIAKTGGEILSSELITVDGYPARRVVIFNKESGILSMSLILVTETHYLNLVASSGLGKEESESRLDFFLKSLKLKTTQP